MRRLSKLTRTAVQAVRRGLVIFRRHTALIYAVYAFPLVLIVSSLTPPLIAPDEGGHAIRSLMVSELRLFPKNDPGPGLTPQDVPADLRDFVMVTHQQLRDEGVFGWRAAQVLPEGSWSSERSEIRSAIDGYFPLFYVPQAVVVTTARLFGVSISDTLRYGRLALGLLFISLAALAIHIARRGKFAFFILLALPMVVFLGTSFSPDAWLIASAALGGAAATRIVPGQGDAKTWLKRYGLALIVLVAIKPVHIALALTTWTQGGIGWAVRTKLVVTVLAATAILWTVLVVSPPDRVADNIDPGAQMEFLLESPGAVFGIAASNLLNQPFLPMRQLFVVTDHPNAYAGPGLTAFLSLVVLAVIFANPPSARQPTGARVMGIGGAVLAYGLTYAALYLVWTPVGSPGPVMGVQGRYLIPILLMAIPSLPPRPLGRNFASPAALLTSVMAAYFLLVVPWTFAHYLNPGL